MRRLTLFLFMMSALLTAVAQSGDAVVKSSGDIIFDEESKVVVERDATDGEKFFSSFFLEGTVALDDWGSLGAGFSFAYVPSHLGGYGTVQFFDHRVMPCLGVVLRPVVSDFPIDWQIFGGFAVMEGVGVEAGMRFGATASGNRGAFGWWSGSLSRIFIGQNTYMTIGVSINVAALTGLFFL